MWFNLPGGTGAPGVFNQEWGVNLQKLRVSGIDVIGVNVNGLFTRINANPAAYGFTDIVGPAQGRANVDPNNYLFWDTRRHPTTATHALIADLAFNDLINTPEPFDAGLVVAGLLAIASSQRFRRTN